MDLNHKLGEAKEESMVDKRMYQRLVGNLIYLAHTRLDIAYSVSVISQFMLDLREPYLQAAYKVLHYLKGNLRKVILFKKNDTLALEAYINADSVLGEVLSVFSFFWVFFDFVCILCWALPFWK